MELRLFVIAKYSEFSPDGSITLVGGDLPGYDLPELPFPLPTVVAAVKLIFNREEALIPHALGVDMVAPDGAIAIPGPQVQVPVVEIEPDKNYFNMMFSVGFGGGVALREGIYKFRLSLDGEEIATRNFKVGISKPEKPSPFTITTPDQNKD